MAIFAGLTDSQRQELDKRIYGETSQLYQERWGQGETWGQATANKAGKPQAPAVEGGQPSDALPKIEASVRNGQSPDQWTPAETTYVKDVVVQETGVKYDNTTGTFTMKVNGKEEEVSALEAVAMTLVSRFKELNQVLGDKVVKMQQELARLNESSEWATKLGDAKNLDSLPEPSEELKTWMKDNNINPAQFRKTDESGNLTQEAKDAMDNAKKLFENRTDQLTSTNDLTALSLKNTSQKSEQAYSTANAIQSILRQLMQGMAQRLG